MERFAKPAVGGIIEKTVNGEPCILMQERCKENGGTENGLMEIPAGKIREFESIFDALRREIWEETGLKITKIHGEEQTAVCACNGYRVVNYEPFSSSQNLNQNYPIMVQIFLCEAEGEPIKQSDESINIRWVPLPELKRLLSNENQFYPMHIITLKKYLSYKGID